MGSLRSYVRSFTGFERDARIFLVVTAIYGVAMSLWWVDFNLYILSLGFDASFVGLTMTLTSAAGAVAAFPASMLSDIVGRRRILLAGTAAATLAMLLLLLVPTATAILVGACAVGAANQAIGVLASPFLSEHSRPEHRNELFSLQNAIGTGINVVAALAGGAFATIVASRLGLALDGPGPYRVLLGVMVVFSALATVAILTIRDDHPARRVRRTPEQRAIDTWTGEPISARPAELVATAGGPISRRGRVRFSIPRPAEPGVFWRLILPGFLISLGAGQVIPFLNVFVRGKFGLDLAELNAVFALTSLGTTLAILLQPALASRIGKIGSVVVVQGASIPFLVVLGFSPVLWTVIAAMAIRNSLMNAGNPIFNAFAMEALPARDRATYSAAANLAWSLGWVISGTWFSILHGITGEETGFTINFIVIIVLYSLGTSLIWRWFHHSRPGREGLVRPA